MKRHWSAIREIKTDIRKERRSKTKTIPRISNYQRVDLFRPFASFPLFLPAPTYSYLVLPSSKKIIKDVSIFFPFSFYKEMKMFMPICLTVPISVNFSCIPLCQHYDLHKSFTLQFSLYLRHMEILVFPHKGELHQRCM